MSNLPITPTDLSQVPVFPECPSVPKDILLHILSFLTEKEHVIASYVCRKWESVVTEKGLLKDVNVAKVTLQILLEQGKYSPLFNNHFPLADLISINQNICILNNCFLDRIEKSGKFESLPNSGCIYSESENLVLTGGWSQTTLSVIDKDTGVVLCTIEPKKFQTLNDLNETKSTILSIVGAFIVAREPLTIVAVLGNRILAKWEIKDNTAQLTQTYLIGIKLNSKTSNCYSILSGDFLYVAGKTSTSSVYCVYNLKDLRIAVPGVHVGTPMANDLVDFSTTKYVVEDQLVCVEQNDLRVYELKSGNLKWAEGSVGNGYYPHTHLTVPTRSIVRSYYKHGVINANIYSIENGQSKELDIEFNKGIEDAKRYGSVLLLATSDEILAYDLESDCGLGIWRLPSDEKITLTSIHFDGSKLFLYLSDKPGNIYIRVLSYLEPAPKPWFEKTKVTIEQTQFVGGFPLKKECSLNAKTTSVALGILSLLLISGALASYFVGSVNLSIGLGLGAAVSAIGGGSALYYVKHKQRREVYV